MHPITGMGSITLLHSTTASVLFAVLASPVMLTTGHLVNITRDCKFIKTAEEKIEGRSF